MQHSVISKRTLWRVVRLASFFVGLGFMVWLVAQILSDPTELRPHVLTIGFLGAVLIAVASNAVVGLMFRELVAKTNAVDRKKSLAAYYYAQIAKYVPGRVAAILLQRSIFSSERALSTVIVANLEITALCALLCSASAISILLLERSILLASVAAAVFVLASSWLMRLNWMVLLSHFKRFLLPDSALPKNSGAHIGVAQSMALSVGVFVLPAVSNLVLLKYALDIDTANAVTLSAVLLLSWVGGLLAFVFPAGIGIRELLVMALGKAIIHEPGTALMASVAVNSRLVQVSADVVGVAAYFIAVRLLRKRGNEH